MGPSSRWWLGGRGATARLEGEHPEEPSAARLTSMHGYVCLHLSMFMYVYICLRMFVFVCYVSKITSTS